MSNYYIGIFDFGFYKNDGKISFWFDILRVVGEPEEDDNSGVSLFCIEKQGDVWELDILFVHIF
jgi:hypothetical protein